MTKTLDFAALAASPLVPRPFDHVVVPGFLAAESVAAVLRDFPAITRPGSFPASISGGGEAFADLVAALSGEDMRRQVAAKLGIDLAGRPPTVTVRGRSKPGDGRIHVDSVAKLVTVLLYLEPDWQAAGGRLRLLAGPGDIDTYAVEIPPAPGLLLAFRNGPQAWHGHTPFEGVRRVLQLNYVTDAGVATRELARHRLSAWIKRSFSGGSGAFR